MIQSKPKQGDIRFGGGFCEHCGDLSSYEADVAVDGTHYCLNCASNMDELLDDPKVQAEINEAVKVQEQREKLFSAAMKKLNEQMNKITPAKYLTQRK